MLWPCFEALTTDKPVVMGMQRTYDVAVTLEVGPPLCTVVTSFGGKRPRMQVLTDVSQLVTST